MSDQNNLEANKALMRRWFEEVWNQGRADFYLFTRNSAKRFPTSKWSSKT